MKYRIKVTDNLSGDTSESEVTIRNSTHFEVQKSTRMNIFRNKKKYTRKVKHKGSDLPFDFAA